MKRSLTRRLKQAHVVLVALDRCHTHLVLPTSICNTVRLYVRAAIIQCPSVANFNLPVGGAEQSRARRAHLSSLPRPKAPSVVLSLSLSKAPLTHTSAVPTVCAYPFPPRTSAVALINRSHGILQRRACSTSSVDRPRGRTALESLSRREKGGSDFSSVSNSSISDCSVSRQPGAATNARGFSCTSTRSVALHHRGGGLFAFGLAAALPCSAWSSASSALIVSSRERPRDRTYAPPITRR